MDQSHYADDADEMQHSHMLPEPWRLVRRAPSPTVAGPLHAEMSGSLPIGVLSGQRKRVLSLRSHAQERSSQFQEDLLYARRKNTQYPNMPLNTLEHVRRSNQPGV